MRVSGNPLPLLATGQDHVQCRAGERAMSPLGLGCVKTPKLKFQIECSSRLRRFEKQKLWQTLLGEDNQENNSTRSSHSDVFTQVRRETGKE
jgi:hypothetical protein